MKLLYKHSMGRLLAIVILLLSFIDLYSVTVMSTESVFEVLKLESIQSNNKFWAHGSNGVAAFGCDGYDYDGNKDFDQLLSIDKSQTVIIVTWKEPSIDDSDPLLPKIVPDKNVKYKEWNSDEILKLYEQFKKNGNTCNIYKTDVYTMLAIGGNVGYIQAVIREFKVFIGK